MGSETAGPRLRRRRVEANGLTFECLCSGDGDRLALCLHGFPDNAGSMDPIRWRLAEAGFTAVAPFMRGYAPTDPAPDGDYSGRALGKDAVELAAALGEEFGTDDAVLVGHDWGAAAAYAAEWIDPDAFSKLVTLAVPPGFDALLYEYPRQALRSWYMWFFQLPDVPERALRWRNFAFIDFLWGLWSPGWDYPEARINDVKETFRAEGTVENALQYYRDTMRPPLPRVGEDRPTLADVPPIETPTLVISGERDGCISPELFEHADEIVGECRVVRVPGAGHFMHQERPDAVGEEIVAFVSDR
ncbi:alpha/beta hydrolase [Natronomonas sp. F2-12]|jgi:pimeloyl-ACP methyl ester carboxylesterase|uniref:Alpha/beta hydrolase n=1 Tax=Natronomonas aquatica TaxID=2841590 RepID=A0A9R1CRR3_9EURY|nr:alpha/beta hydrolase [Natronomonas aquatica]MCQ4332613.1 alpha/beta hydrolase [Natronomonas aquatica]